MGDQQKVLKRRKKKEAREDSQEPSKEENEVGKYLRWNCPSKPSTMMGEKVEYFIGSKAVECLLDSKWASGKGGTEILFTDRASAESYLDRLLILGFFNRVVRIKKIKKTKEEKEKEKAEREKEKEKENEKGSGKEKDESEGKKLKKRPKKETAEEGKKPTEGNGDGDGKKKRKLKVKLELHEDQIFIDDDDQAYVWRFDPVHPKTFIMGVLVVIATIAICLFPLWPSYVRECVWYLSVLAAVAVGAILVLAVLRYVFFAIVWVLTAGNHHFWLLPNLTEECGFFESFVPLYTHEYKGSKPEEKQRENEIEKDDENKEEKEGEEETSQGNKDESSEEKEHIDKEPWITLTEEEVATARNEVDKDLEDLNDPLASEVKC